MSKDRERLKKEILDKLWDVQDKLTNESDVYEVLDAVQEMIEKL